MIFLAGPEWVDRLCADQYKNAINNLMINNKMADALGTDGTGTGLVGTALSGTMGLIKANIFPAMKGLAVAIACLFFFISLMELIMSERLTFEYFIKFFGKLAISIGLILLCPELAEQCLNFGNALGSGIQRIDLDPSGAGSGRGIDWLGNNDILAWGFYNGRQGPDSNWLFLLVQTVVTVGPMNLLSLIIVAVCYVISFSRVLELLVRACFLPIAVALMADDGWKGSGGRYIKKYIALCSQAAVLIVISKVCGLIIVAAIDAKIRTSIPGGIISTSSCITVGMMSDILIIALAAAVACIKLMFSSIGIINDVFGV